MSERMNGEIIGYKESLAAGEKAKQREERSCEWWDSKLEGKQQLTRKKKGLNINPRLNRQMVLGNNPHFAT